MTQFGRPTLTPEQVDDLFRKLEPYLKTGLTINKACLEAQIPKSTVYDLCRENNNFAERIEASRNYCAVMLNNIVMIELTRIMSQGGLPLTANDIKFIQWFATHSLLNRDEFKEQEKDEKPVTPEYNNLGESDEELRAWFEKAFDDVIDEKVLNRKEYFKELIAKTEATDDMVANPVAESTTPPV